MTNNETDFPVPNGFELDGTDKRPGEPLHPGTNTIVDPGNHPLKAGQVIQVWWEAYADGHGTEVVTGKLQVIGDTIADDEEHDGDVFAILADEDALTASTVYRLDSGMDSIQPGRVINVPEYDREAGELTITRSVQVRGSRQSRLLEARKLGKKTHWGPEKEL